MMDGSAGVLRIDGALTMQTARSHLELGRDRLAGGDLLADLSGVTEADSAAVALLFAWLRTAAEAGHTLTVRGLPDGMRSLASLYGVDDLLPPDA